MRHRVQAGPGFQVPAQLRAREAPFGTGGPSCDPPRGSETCSRRRRRRHQRAGERVQRPRVLLAGACRRRTCPGFGDPLETDAPSGSFYSARSPCWQPWRRAPLGLLPPPQAGLGVLVSVSQEAFVVLSAGKLLLRKLGKWGPPAAPGVGSIRPPPSAWRPGPRSPGAASGPWNRDVRGQPGRDVAPLGPQQGALAPLQLTPTQACLPHHQGSHRPWPSLGIRVPLPAALAVPDTGHMLKLHELSGSAGLFCSFVLLKSALSRSSLEAPPLGVPEGTQSPRAGGRLGAAGSRAQGQESPVSPAFRPGVKATGVTPPSGGPAPGAGRPLLGRKHPCIQGNSSELQRILGKGRTRVPRLTLLS